MRLQVRTNKASEAEWARILPKARREEETKDGWGKYSDTGKSAKYTLPPADIKMIRGAP